LELQSAVKKSFYNWSIAAVTATLPKYFVMKNRFAITYLILLMVTLFSCEAQQTANNLDATAFEKNISSVDSVQLLDVRTAAEYNSGHIKNALLADWKNDQEFNRRISFIDKKKPVYVYCLGGGRSAAAAKVMRENGFEKVYELTGGINTWKAANKAVEGKSDAKEMSIEAFNDAISSTPFVLVDFGAVWCPPCKQMEPVLNKLQTEMKGKFTLVKVDGGNDTEVMKQHNVTALPVFIVFKNGKEVWRRDGIATKEELAAQLQ
jgi:thioredoxin